MFDFGINARRSFGMKICTADDFNRIIDDTKVSTICAEIADLREQKMRGELNMEGFKKAKNRLKIMLPVFTFMSHYTNRVRRNENAVASGLSIFDIDNITPPGVPEGEDAHAGLFSALYTHMLSREPITDENTIEEMRKLGIVLVHVSPSLEGLHIIFVTPADKTYAEALEWMGKQLGCEFDTTTKDPARCSFAVPRDYILYINNEELFKERDLSPRSPLQGEGRRTAKRLLARGIPSPNLSRSTGEGRISAKLSEAGEGNANLSLAEAGGGNANLSLAEVRGGNANPSLAEDNVNIFSPARGGDKREGMPQETHSQAETEVALAETEVALAETEAALAETEAAEAPTALSLKGREALSKANYAFNLCMKEAKLHEVDLNVEGARHNSLLSILSVGAARLIPRELINEVLKLHMPNNWDDENIQQLLDDFYTNYNNTKVMSQALRDIHAKVMNFTPPRLAEGEDVLPVNADEEEDIEPYEVKIPKIDEEHLPLGFKASVRGVPDNLKWPAIVAALPIAATYADSVTVRYCDGKKQQLQLMSIIVGAMASGKSVCMDVFGKWARIFYEEDDANFEEEQAIKIINKNKRQNERGIETDHKPIHIEAFKASEAQLCQRINDANGHSICSAGEELDDLVMSNQGALGNKMPLARLGFDGGRYKRDMAGSQSVSINVKHVRWNWMVTGTWGQFNKLFRKDNIENGLSSRVLVAEMPDMTFAPMPQYTTEDPTIQEEIDKACEILRSKEGFFDTPKLREAIYNWQENVRVTAEKNLDNPRGVFRKRSAVIGFRAGVIAFLLNNEQETEDVIKFALDIAQYTMEEQVKCFGPLLMDNTISAIGECERKTENSTIFDQLPEEFSSKDLRAIKGYNAPRQTLNSCIRSWENQGWVTKIRHGLYRKATRECPNVRMSECPE